MFNPADFDALTAALEERYAQRCNTPDMEAERAMLLYAVSTTRHLAESFGMMAAPVRLCQECGAAPTIAAYSRMCESCMRSRLMKELELAQEQATNKGEGS